MLRLILNRFIQAVVVVFALVSFTFFAVRLTPGNPFVDEKAIPEHILEQTKAAYGLDGNWITQFGIYWKKVLVHGDLGPSLSLFGRTVTGIISESFPVSLTLGLLALILGIGTGLPLGALAALRRNGIIDYASMIVAMAGICVPSFVLGPLFQLYIARNFDGLSVAGWERPTDIILPAIALGTGVAAYVARLTRGGMLEILSQDYIRTARAKGVPPLTIVTRHALRGAVLPAVTYLGPAFAAIITGSFVIETIFQVPGMGQHFVTAVTSQDYFLLQGLVMFYGLLMAGANLSVDIALAALNPRLRAKS